MASKINFISEITPKRETWKIKVRIIRLWKTPGFEKPSEEYSIEMVLMDEKGSKISATVKKSHVDKFSPLLLENEYRIITNFGVGQNTGSYKTTEHPYKIIFFFSTAVQSCEDLRIPRYGFSFVSYDDIMSNKLDDTILI
ncbi:Replication protein A 70 kDa DNA-binding subunit, partial [Bienertia sinuspersici]